MLILQSYSQETCYVAITKMQKYQKFQSPITMYLEKLLTKQFVQTHRMTLFIINSIFS
jgi:DNA-binding LytR/AlgR family response regulator